MLNAEGSDEVETTNNLQNWEFSIQNSEFETRTQRLVSSVSILPLLDSLRGHDRIRLMRHPVAGVDVVPV